MNRIAAADDATIADLESKLKMKRDVRIHKYADGTHREFYQIGLSPNKTGISVYIMGIEDKKLLA